MAQAPLRAPIREGAKSDDKKPPKKTNTAPVANERKMSAGEMNYWHACSDDLITLAGSLKFE